MREKGQTEAAKTLETPVFSRGIEILTEKFELYEYDSKVMPFLLFNMAVRNIECKVYHSDVLKQEVFHTYKIARGKKFGRFTEI